MQRLGMRFDHASTLSVDGDTFEAAIHLITHDEWAHRQEWGNSGRML
jgi:hypothetical protein